MRTTDELVEEWNAETRADCDIHRACKAFIRKDIETEISTLAEELSTSDDAKHKAIVGLVWAALSRFGPDIEAGAEACYLCGVRGRCQEEILATMLTSRILDEMPGAMSLFDSEYQLWDKMYLFTTAFSGIQKE